MVAGRSPMLPLVCLALAASAFLAGAHAPPPRPPVELGLTLGELRAGRPRASDRPGPSGRRLDAGGTVTPSSLRLERSGDWVKVNVTGIHWPSRHDWLGVYSPTEGGDPNAPATDVLKHYPVKFQYLQSSLNPRYNSTGSAALEFQLVNMRADYFFVVVQGGAQFPTPVSFSKPVSFAFPAEPLQARLSLTGGGPTEMRVAWTSVGLRVPVVRWGLVSAKTGRPLKQAGEAAAGQSTYTRGMMCGPPANGLGWRDPGTFYSAVLSGLRPGARYWYTVGEGGGAPLPAGTDWDGRRARFTFRAAPAVGPTQTVRFAAFGDMGQAPPDDSFQHSFDNRNRGEIGAVGVTKRLAAQFGVRAPGLRRPGEAVRTLRTPQTPQPLRTLQTAPQNAASQNAPRNATTPFDLVVHIGDIAYAVGFASEWDAFHAQVQPLASAFPWMTCIGNHEQGSPGTAGPGAPPWANDTDSGGECGVPYAQRFPMPRPGGEFWYAFAHGPVAFVMMSTEHAFGAGSAQLAALDALLARVDRTQTPWLVLAGHRPMWIDSNWSGDLQNAQLLRASVEPLLYKHRVDLALWGHHHTYQRSCPLLEGGGCAGTHPAAGESSLARDPREEGGVAAEKGGRRGGEHDTIPGRTTQHAHAVVHMVIGMAGYELGGKNLARTKPAYTARADGTHYGYLAVEASPAGMRLDFVNAEDGAVLDSTTIPASR
jgi:hypothetical protein